MMHGWRPFVKHITGCWKSGQGRVCQSLSFQVYKGQHGPDGVGQQRCHGRHWIRSMFGSSTCAGISHYKAAPSFCAAPGAWLSERRWR
eukprot:2999412-Karenia_brevis.AAC.1